MHYYQILRINAVLFNRSYIPCIFTLLSNIAVRLRATRCQNQIRKLRRLVGGFMSVSQNFTCDSGSLLQADYSLIYNLEENYFQILHTVGNCPHLTFTARGFSRKWSAYIHIIHTFYYNLCRAMLLWPTTHFKALHVTLEPMKKINSCTIFSDEVDLAKCTNIFSAFFWEKRHYILEKHL